MEKDLRYAVAAGETSDGKLPTTAATQGVFATAQRRGLGNDNIHGVAKLYLPEG